MPIKEHFHLRWLHLTGAINSHSNLCSQGERCGGHGRGWGRMGASLSLSGCIHSFYNHSLVHSVIYTVTHSLTHSFIHAVTYSFPLSFIHAATQSFTHSLTHSVIHSFTHSVILQKSLGGCRSWPVLQNVSFPQPLSLYYKGHLHFELLDLGKTACFSVFPQCRPILPTS